MRDGALIACAVGLFMIFAQIGQVVKAIQSNTYAVYLQEVNCD